MVSENKFVDDIKERRIRLFSKTKQVQNQWEELKWKVVLIQWEKGSTAFTS